MRPKKKISGHNSENLDKEFQKEEKKLEAKRQKMQVFYEDRRKALWGNKDEKLEVQSKRKDEIDKHLETRTKVMKKENELEKNVSGTLNNQIILATNTEKKMEQGKIIQYLQQFFFSSCQTQLFVNFFKIAKFILKT